MGFETFAGHKYLNLETFKKSGEGVKTPVWFAADPSVRLDSSDAKLFVYTIGVSGKVKRIRNNPRVRIAPCTASGKLLGDWVQARAEIVDEAAQQKVCSLEAVVGFLCVVPAARADCFCDPAGVKKGNERSEFPSPVA